MFQIFDTKRQKFLCCWPVSDTLKGYCWEADATKATVYGSMVNVSDLCRDRKLTNIEVRKVTGEVVGYFDFYSLESANHLVENKQPSPYNFRMPERNTLARWVSS